MNFQSYLDYFEGILNNPVPPAPYDKPDYFNYAKLNWTRMQRWLKHGVLTEEIKTIVSTIKTPQYWIIITEPWCGDAAHVVPFLHLIAELNPLIKTDYELRDAEPFRINEYLTKGGKSIPKLIIRDEIGKDLATWGPRPAECQLLFDKLKEEQADFETFKIELQKWYNHDEGEKILKEIGALLK
jgi:hypothetical protein